jgi:uncharacterized damage-inducible protein DinB
MNAYSRAIETRLRSLTDDLFRQLDGVPESDLNHWLPRDEMSDVNTMYALATHIVGSSEFWVLEAAGGRNVNRDRPSEFKATGTVADLRSRYDKWLNDTHDLLASMTEADLNRLYVREANPAQGTGAVQRTAAECLVHAVEHVGIHVGHLQLQRQLWDAERGG